MWDQLNIELLVDYATKFFLAAFLGTLLSFRRQPDQYRLQLIEAHALLAIAGALFISVIAGDIIRAVGLLGAASVVRYRYAVQNPRDASTLILALGVGLACGSDLLLVALVATLLILFILKMVNLFPEALPFSTLSSREEMILRLNASDYDKLMERIRTIFQEKDIDYSLISFERKVRKGTLDEMITEVSLHVDMSGTLSLHDLTKLIVDDNVFRVTWEETGRRTW